MILFGKNSKIVPVSEVMIAKPLKLCLFVAAFTSILPELAMGEIEGMPWDCHVIDRSSLGADGVKLADINGDGWTEKICFVN